MNWTQLIKAFKINNLYLCTGLFTKLALLRSGVIRANVAMAVGFLPRPSFLIHSSGGSLRAGGE
jgi:hypothetical protein